MAIDWLTVATGISGVLTSLGGLVKSNRARKDLLIRELKINIKAFKSALKSSNINYDRLLDFLENDQIKIARGEKFTFPSIKNGQIAIIHVKDPRNIKFVGKDCGWLFKNIDEKIEGLRKLKKYYGSLNNVGGINVALKFYNLFFKMKLLSDFIK